MAMIFRIGLLQLLQFYIIWVFWDEGKLLQNLRSKKVNFAAYDVTTTIISN